MAAIIISMISVGINIIGVILCICRIDSIDDAWNQSYKYINERLDKEVKASKERDRNIRSIAMRIAQRLKPKKNETNNKSN